MKTSIFKLYFLLIFFSSCSLISEKVLPNYDREKNLNHQMESTSFDAEFISLSHDHGEDFKLLFHEKSDSSQTVLLLHGRGLYPNEPRVMNPLIDELRDEYNIYSLQLPVLNKGRTYVEYTDIFNYSDSRIKKTIEYITPRSSEIIIIAHSCGAHMLSSFLKKNQNTFDKLILISAGAIDKNEKSLPYYDYTLFSGEILNVLADNDHTSVKLFSQYISSLNIENLENFIIHDADHYYRDNVASLVMKVKKWLISD